MSNNRRVKAGDLGLLCRKLDDIAAEWDLYGLILGIPAEQIDKLKENQKTMKADVTRCMGDMLKYWTKKFASTADGGATWGKLIKAAERMEEMALAEDIREQHGETEEVDLTDFEHVIDILAPVIPDWHSFGLQLDIPPAKLNIIAGKAPKFLNDMLAKYITLKGKEATIDHLISSLRCKPIENNELADRLCKDKELQSHYSTCDPQKVAQLDVNQEVMEETDTT